MAREKPKSTSTPFAVLASLCLKLDRTTKKTEKSALLGEFLGKLHSKEIAPAVLLLLGKIFSATDPRTLDVSWRTLQKVEQQTAKRGKKKAPLTIPEVHQHFGEIAGTSGQGSRQRKEELLAGLLSRVSANEKKYLVKMIFGEMQHGVAEGVMQQGIAEAIGADPAVVRRAGLLLGDIAEVARLALTKGKAALARASIQLMRPIQPMLAELAYNEIQRSPRYKSKLALRFARIKRIRTDKSADQVNSLDHLRQLYERQFERKGGKSK